MTSETYCSIDLDARGTIINITNLDACESLDAIKFEARLALETLVKKVNRAIRDVKVFTNFRPVVKTFAIDTDVAYRAIFLHERQFAILQVLMQLVPFIIM